MKRFVIATTVAAALAATAAADTGESTDAQAGAPCNCVFEQIREREERAAALAAADAPAFMRETFPPAGVDAAWRSYQAVFLDPHAALDPKTKELIALGVSAQVPCAYCIYFHTKAARERGASEAEIREALASAATVRQWGTLLEGSQYGIERWREEVDALFSGQ